MGILDAIVDATNAAIDATVTTPAQKAGGLVWDYGGSQAYNNTLGSWGQATEQSYASPIQLAVAQAQAQIQAQQAAYQQQAAAANLSPEYRQLYEYTQNRPAYEADPTYQGLSPEYQELYSYMQNRQGPAPTVADQQAVQQQEQTLTKDFERIFQEQRADDEIEDWRGLSDSLVRVYETARDSGDEQQMQLVQSRLNEYQRQIQPHIEILYPGWWDENFDFEEGPSTFESGAASAFGMAAPILNKLDAGRRASFRAINYGLERGLPDSPNDLAGLFLGAGDAFIDDEGAILEKDVDGDGDVGTRELFGLDPQAGGTVGDIYDVLGQIFLDPTTYVSLGTGAKVKGALRGLQAAAAKEGPEAAARMTALTKLATQSGTKAWSATDRQFAELMARRAAQDVATQHYAGLTGKARAAQAKLINRNADIIAKKQEKLAADAMKALDKGARSGLKIGGYTVAPFNNRLTRGLGLVDRTRFGDVKGPLAQDGYETVGRWQPRATFEDVTGTRTRQEPTYGTRWQARPESVTFDDEVVTDVPWRQGVPKVEYTGPDSFPWETRTPYAARDEDYVQPWVRFEDDGTGGQIDHFAMENQILDEVLPPGDLGGWVSPKERQAQIQAMIDRGELSADDLLFDIADGGDHLVFDRTVEKASPFFKHWTKANTETAGFHPRIMRVDPVTGEMVERPIQYVYRVLHLNEYRDIMERGYMKSKGFANERGGTFASLDPRSAAEYLGDDSVMVRIKFDPADGWVARDGYRADQIGSALHQYPEVATTQQIPAERIDMTSSVVKFDSKNAFSPNEQLRVRLTSLRNEMGDRAGVRRPKALNAPEDATVTGTRRVERTEPWREVPTEADPRIDRLRAKAASTPYEAEAEAFARKADELADRLNPNQGPNATRTNLRWTEEQYQAGVREVAEEFTERVARNDWTWIEETLPRMRPETFRVITDNKPGLLRRIVQSDRGFAAAIRQRLIPRANINRRAGADISESFLGEQRQAQGRAMRLTDEVNARLKGKIGKAAVGEFGGDREAAFRYINEALSDADAYARAMIEAGPRTQDLLTAVRDVQEQVWNGLTDAQRAMFGNKETYIPRTISADAEKWIKNLSDEQIQNLRRVGEGDLADLVQGIKQGGEDALAARTRFNDNFLNQRTISPEVQDLFKVNDEVREIFEKAGITDIGDLYETDVLAAWSIRARTAFQSRIEADMLEGMRNLVDENGQRIVMNASEYADSRTSKFGTTPITIGDETLYMQKDVAAAWNQVKEVVLDPYRLDELGNLWNELNGMWARYALLSPGYHSRNAMSNTVLNFLGGLKNPARYADAMSLQRTRAKVYRDMGKTGKSFDEAFAAHKGISVDALQKNADYVTIKNLEEQRIMSGLVDDIFLDQEVAGFGKGTLFNPRKRSKYNPTHGSRAIGTAFEHNARVALYLDATRKGMTPQAAAAHVRQYLFDYEDLTRFETGIRRNVSRFYTFMRKNTALQIMTLAKTPGKIINAERIINAVMDATLGDVDPEGANAQLPRWASAAGLEFRGGNAYGFEDPFGSAMETVQNLLAPPVMMYQAARQAQPGLPALPEGVENAVAFNDLSDLARDSLALFSGLPTSILFGMTELRTGTDLFTGGPIEMDGSEPFWRMVGAVQPAVDRGWGVWDKVNDEDKGWTTSMMLLNQFAGLQVYSGEQAANSARWALNAELEKINEEANLFTREELQDFGRVEATNRFMYVMAYGGMEREPGEDPVFNPQKLKEELAGFVPQEILNLYPETRGLDRQYPTQGLPEDDMAADQQRLREAEQALVELLGRDLNPREKAKLVLSMTDVYMEDQEMLGLEPFRDYQDPRSNVFTKDAIPDLEGFQPDPMAQLDELASAIGLEFNDLQALSPLLSDVERVTAQALATGASQAEAEEMAWEYMTSELSRTDTQILFGEGALSDYGYMGMDDRDLTYEQNRAWQDAELLRLGNRLYGWGKTEQEILTAVLQMNVGTTDQRTLFSQGLLDQVSPYPKSRENVQTEEEQARDALRQFEAIRRGALDGAFIGERPEDDPRNSWDGWEDGRQTWGD